MSPQSNKALEMNSVCFTSDQRCTSVTKKNEDVSFRLFIRLSHLALRSTIFMFLNIAVLDTVLESVLYVNAIENTTAHTNQSLQQETQIVIEDLFHWNPDCPIYPTPEPLAGKKGVGLPFRRSSSRGSWIHTLPRLFSLNTYWSYSWAMERLDEFPSQLEFMPMAWNGGDSVTELQENLDKLVKPRIEAGLVKRFLGFNEPDLETQSNMTVEETINRWPALESLNVPLVSPSCAHCSGPWIEQFLRNASQSCLRVDYLGVHWYGSPNIKSFRRFLWKLHKKYKLPIIITEFAVADWEAETVAENRWSQKEVLMFVQSMLPWLERTSWIVGYAWFHFKQDRAVGWSSALFDDFDNLTPLGRYYQSVNSSNINGDLTITVE